MLRKAIRGVALLVERTNERNKAVAMVVVRGGVSAVAAPGVQRRP